MRILAPQATKDSSEQLGRVDLCVPIGVQVREGSADAAIRRLSKAKLDQTMTKLREGRVID